MKNKRNPYKIRAWEYIESDDAFIKLFSPEPLDAFFGEDIWDKPIFIQDPPGGGKTTLLHLFTPRVLWNVVGSGSRGGDVHKILTELSAINEYKPLVLGIYLSCSYTYSTIEEITGENLKKDLIFNSLLNSRIILAFIVNLCTLTRLSFPEDLEYLVFSSKEGESILDTLGNRFTAQELHNWASNIERNICEALDSFDPLESKLPPLHQPLISLKVLTDFQVTIKDTDISTKMLVMLDNVQELSNRQRQGLRRDIVNIRSNVSIWCAERFEALPTSELLPSGIIEGRDFEGVIRLSGKMERRFSKIIADISERRAENSAVREDLIASGLTSTLSSKTTAILTEAKEKLSTSIVRDYPKYIQQVQQILNSKKSDEDITIYLRGLMILAYRDATRKQISLFETLPASDEEVERRLTSSILESAHLFLAKEYKIPYYYGFEKLVKLSSSNIQQFLSLAVDLFEDLVSADLIKHQVIITPERQEAIILEAIKQQCNSLPHSQGIEIRNLLGAFGDYCSKATYVPRASYAPGVTGIGISNADRIRLSNPKELDLNPDLKVLSNTITRAVANNFLQARPEMRSGGKSTLVLYLNRAWCGHFGLPLGYGGWRERPLEDLIRWAQTGQITQRDEARLINDIQ